MDANLKKKWVAALRSGKYKQGKNTLHKNGRYCCLGVLRNVANKHDNRSDNYPDADQFEKWPGTYLSVAQLKEFGLTNKIQKELADLNDGDEDTDNEPIPFEIIAGLIEETL